MDRSPLMTTAQLAAQLGVSRSTVARWCDRGLWHVRAPRPRSHRRIAPLYVSVFLATLPASRQPPGRFEA